MSKKIVFICLLLLAAVRMNAQHRAMYSQYMFNGFILNPAYAGSNDGLIAGVLYRNQWTGLDGAPKTACVYAHTPLKNKKINLGMSFISDKYGITNKNKFNIAYSYRITFPKGDLFFGAQGGINFLHDRWNEIQTTTAGDKTFIGQDQATALPEAGFGVYYKSEKYYAGLSAPSLLSKNAPGLLTKPTMLNAGYVFFLPNEIRMKHSILIKYLRNSPVEFDLNTNIYYKSFGVGFSYRTNDAVIFLLEYDVNDQLHIGYSYDQTISSLGTYNKGSHEVLLRYSFKFNVVATNPRYF